MADHRQENSEKHTKNKKRLKPSIIAAIVVVVVIVLGATGFLIYRDFSETKKVEVSAEHNYNVGDSFRTVVYNGETYSYNTHVRSILVAGVDTDDVLVGHAQYGDYARADSIYLMLLDGMHDKLTIVSISRDTMTQIRKFSKSGTDMGTIETHIGYAYSMGNGGDASCRNLVEAVESLTNGVPIEDYMILSRGALEAFAQLFGDVKVTLPGDELTAIDPEMKKGSVITVNADNMFTYMVYRDTDVDFSNDARIERQLTYIKALAAKLKNYNKTELRALFDREEELEPYVQKSITRDQYLTLINMFMRIPAENVSIVKLPGENVAGEIYDEFYPDKEAVKELFLELFYVKK